MNTLSVSTHSHPKVAAGQLTGGEANTAVSTHSHPKVAAACCFLSSRTLHCFNTQPPEGGCLREDKVLLMFRCFNTQPPEGGCTL